MFTVLLNRFIAGQENLPPCFVHFGSIGRIGRFNWGPLEGPWGPPEPVGPVGRANFSGEMIRGARNATIVPHGRHLSIEPSGIVFENIEANMKRFVRTWNLVTSG